MTVKHVAHLCQKGETTVYRWIETGKLKAIRTGDPAWRVRKEDLEAFLRRPL